jgi:hypothetical protein
MINRLFCQERFLPTGIFVTSKQEPGWYTPEEKQHEQNEWTIAAVTAESGQDMPEEYSVPFLSHRYLYRRCGHVKFHMRA